MTEFSSLYGLIRFCAGDQGFPDAETSEEGTHLFSDGQIDLSITLVIERHLTDYHIVTTGAVKSVDPQITGDDKWLLIFRAALLLLQPGDAISFRTPTLSVTRRGEGKERQIEWLQKEIEKLECGGHIPIASDTEVVAYFERATRMTDEIGRANIS